MRSSTTSLASFSILAAAATSQNFAPMRAGLLPPPLVTHSATVHGDIDGDGDVDLVRLPRWAFWYPPEVAWNDGEGRFTSTPFAIPAVDNATCLAAADFDGDGDLDVMIGQFDYLGASRDLFMRNDGNGAFTHWWTATLPGATAGMLPFDADGDGDVDLILRKTWRAPSCGVLCSQPSRLLRNNGLGILTLDATFPQPPPLAYHESVTLVDHDGDGLLDILFGGLAPQVFHNLGNGAFSTTPVAWPAPLTRVHACDLDNDGDDDLLGADAYAGPATVWRNDGGGNFVRIAIPASLPTAQRAIAGDLDGDGLPDLLVTETASASPGRLQLLQNTGGLAFVDMSAAWLDAIEAGFTDALLFDADGDGDLDLHQLAGWSRMLLNDGAGRLTVAERWDPFDRLGARSVHEARIDGDPHPDLVGVARQGDAYLAWRNDGFGRFEAPTVVATAHSLCQTSLIVPFDADGDGDDDCYLAECGQNRLLRNDGGGVFTDVTPTALPADPRIASSVEVADFDLDGDLDLFVCRGRNYGAAAIQDSLLLNDGFGNFVDLGPQRIVDSEATVESASADYDGDGDRDLLLIGSSVRLFENDGTAAFTDVTAARLPATTAGYATWADIDNDGDPDLVLGSWGAAQLLRNDPGGFVDVSAQLPMSQYSWWPRACDFDVDGDADLLIGGKWFVNDGTGNFTASPIELPAERDHSTKRGIVDLDGDGDAEVFAFGLHYNLRSQLEDHLPPRLGKHGELRLHATPTTPGTDPFAVLLVAAALAPAPIALGPAGTWRLDPAASFVHSWRVLPGPDHHATVRYFAPNVAGLLGTPLWAQAAILPGPALSGWLASNAVPITLRR